MVKVCGPIINAIQWLDPPDAAACSALKITGEQANAALAQEEIRGAIEYRHEEGLVESRDRRMLGGVLDLAEMDVSEIMVHRKTHGAARRRPDARASWSPRRWRAAYTRLPLYRDDPENIVGVLHARTCCPRRGRLERGDRRASTSPAMAGASPGSSPTPPR